MAADAELTQLISQVKVEGNFDQTDDVVLNWLSRRHQLMCSRAKCYRVAGTSTTVDAGVLAAVTASGGYPLGEDPGFVELDELSVNGVPYSKITIDEYMGLSAGSLSLRGSGGVYASSEDQTGFKVAQIWPLLVVGDVVAVRAVFTPPEFDSSATVSPPNLSFVKIPREFKDALVAGAIATGLSRTEQRPDLAAPYEQEFSAACEEIRRLQGRRMRGSQPAKIRVVGYDV